MAIEVSSDFQTVFANFLRLGRFVAWCCALSLVGASAAHAELIRFRLSGTVTVEDELILPPDVVTGAPFTAYLSYDTGVPDQWPDDPNRGAYVVESSLGQVELILQVGSLEIRNAPGSNALIQVYNDAGLIPGLSPPSDSLGFSMPSIGGPESFLSKISLDLLDLQYTAWNSDKLPTSIDLSALEGAQVFAGGGAIRERFYSIRGQISEVVRIPEASSLQMSLYSVALLSRLAKSQRRLQLRLRARSFFREFESDGSKSQRRQWNVKSGARLQFETLEERRLLTGVPEDVALSQDAITAILSSGTSVPAARRRRELRGERGGPGRQCCAGEPNRATRSN